jgi:hypothetical protein
MQWNEGLEIVMFLLMLLQKGAAQVPAILHHTLTRLVAALIRMPIAFRLCDLIGGEVLSR